jgi:hypothetical protein
MRRYALEKGRNYSRRIILLHNTHTHPHSHTLTPSHPQVLSICILAMCYRLICIANFCCPDHLNSLNHLFLFAIKLYYMQNTLLYVYKKKQFQAYSLSCWISRIVNAEFNKQHRSQVKSSLWCRKCLFLCTLSLKYSQKN